MAASEKGPQPISLSDYDKMCSMSLLEEWQGERYKEGYIIRNIQSEEREDQETHEITKVVSFEVDDFGTGEWIGTVVTSGVVAMQLQRMIAHGLPPEAPVGPVLVRKGGQTGRSLTFVDARAPF